MRSLIEFWRNHMVLMIVLLFLYPAVVLGPFIWQICWYSRFLDDLVKVFQGMQNLKFLG